MSENYSYTGKQAIHQLDKRKGGYFYLFIDAQVVNQFKRGKDTRLICTIDKTVSLRCGLNHFGDGNFYIIIASRYFKELGIKPGDEVNYIIEADPDQLGVDIPEVLEALIEQDQELKEIYDSLSDGRKRTLIFSINRIKNIDIQVQNIIDFLHKESLKRKGKRL